MESRTEIIQRDGLKLLPKIVLRLLSEYIWCFYRGRGCDIRQLCTFMKYSIPVSNNLPSVAS